MSYNPTLRAAIEAAIDTPANPKISGTILQSKLLDIISAIDAGAVFKGAATPATSPSGESNCFYLATTQGTYTNFIDVNGDAIVLAQGEFAFLSTVLVNENLRWEKIVLPFAPTNKVKVLVLGNSFSADEFSYLPFVMKNVAPDVELTLGLATIGGSPLAQHAAYVTGETFEYEGVTYYTENNRYYRQEDGGEPEMVSYGYHKSVGGNPWAVVNKPVIPAILIDEQWDIIVFQADVLNGEGDWDVYYAPYVFKIEQAIFGRLNYPVKLGWLPAHSIIHRDEYTGDTPPSHPAELLFDRWKRRAANSMKMLQQTGFSILFPSDTAVQNLRYLSMFQSMGRRGFLAWDTTGHLQEGIGPLASAYTNTIVIIDAMGFGFKSVYGEQTRPDGTWIVDKKIPGPNGYIEEGGVITWYIAGEGNHYDDYCSLAQIAAVNAVKYPFSLIDPSVLPDTQGGKTYSNRAIFTDNQPATNENVKQLSSAVAGKADVCNPISYAALKSLRDRGRLVPGTWYRITDYACTTTQENTQSAGHLFDIIVRADDASHLNENAYAAHHEGDTYFTNCKLEAWQLKYSIDNDTNRFAWADDTNGKGVVYFMKDEWNNECPYDFKNIMFKRWAVTEYDKCPTLVVDAQDNNYGYYYGAMQLDGESQVLVNATYGEDFGWFYTFALKDLATENWYDYTVVAHLGLKNDEGGELACYDNHLEPGTDEYSSGKGEMAKMLNNIVFFNCFTDLSGTSYADDFSYCNNNRFLGNCHSNTFGNGFQNNSFGNGCSQNSFGNECYQNSFGNYCYYNSFGNNCGDNTFGNNCNNNSFGNNCYSNSFGNYCYYNSFGNGFQNNSFGNYCYYNSFGNDCNFNTFGNNCGGNTFGNDCSINTFGNYFQNNSFGNYCYYNSFGNSYNNNSFGNYCQSITVFDGVQNCSVIGGSQSAPVKNAQILNGTAGASAQNKLTIGFAANKAYTQCAAKNTEGTLKIWNPADLAE